MQNDDINLGLISDKLHEMLVEDLDFESSEINRFLNNQALNLILTTLSTQQRIEFYQLLGDNNHLSAKNMVLKYIPDFHQQLYKKVKDKFQDIL